MPPQLVAGNTVLLKHARDVWGSALRLEELYHEAGVPTDAFRVLKIGSEQSDDVIARPEVRGVTLTGSDGAGSYVASLGARHLEKTVVELGSNDAFVVLSDADIDLAPVASLIRAADDEDAMRIADDSRYGLGGGIFSADVERATELARTEFDTGIVNINGFNLAKPHLPFGGVKDSGYGREHGEAGMREFLNVKTIFVDG